MKSQACDKSDSIYATLAQVTHNACIVPNNTCMLSMYYYRAKTRAISKFYLSPTYSCTILSTLTFFLCAGPVWKRKLGCSTKILFRIFGVLAPSLRLKDTLLTAIQSQIQRDYSSPDKVKVLDTLYDVSL